MSLNRREDFIGFKFRDAHDAIITCHHNNNNNSNKVSRNSLTNRQLTRFFASTAQLQSPIAHTTVDFDSTFNFNIDHIFLPRLYSTSSKTVAMRSSIQSTLSGAYNFITPFSIKMTTESTFFLSTKKKTVFHRFNH